MLTRDEIALFLTSLLIATCLAGCEAEKEEEEDEILPAKVTKISTGTLFRRLGYTGDIEGKTEIRVFSQIPERIMSLSAREGQRVKQGDILAIVRSKTLTQGVRQAAGGLDAARANRDALTDQVGRVRKLAASGAATSSQLLTLESQLAAAEAQVRSLEAALGQAKQIKGDSVVRAPIDGLIGQVFVEVGDMAVPQIPVCTIVDMDVVTLKVRIPESDLTSVSEGQPVTFRVISSNGGVRRGTVTRVSPVLDRASRTATIEVDYDNADHVLKPGMLARVEVEVERRDNVVWAPKDSLTVTAERRGDKRVYRAVVAKDGKAEEREVLIGLEDGEKAQVLEGLEAGDDLVTEGQHLMADGDDIKIVEGEGADPEAPADDERESASEARTAADGG